MRRRIGSDEALLRALGVDPARVIAREPISGGLSGGHIERLTVRETGPSGVAGLSRRVLKHLAPEAGWLGVHSRDTLMREGRLWSRGVLGDLPWGIETGVLAWAEIGQTKHPAAGALFLRDESGHLWRDPLRTPPGRLPTVVLALLDHLARLHAHYWSDPRLREPTLGLMPPEAALLLIAPDAVASRAASGDETPYLALARAGWEAFFRLAPPDAANTLRGIFANPKPSVSALAKLPWTLVHGDVWGPNLGLLPPTHRAPRRGARLLLLDWALATVGPATYDPLWLCGTWHGLEPVRVLAAYRARLERHLAARGKHLAPATWRALADAGYLRTALTCGEALGRAAADAPAGAPKRRAEARARWWAERAARAARRLTMG